MRKMSSLANCVSDAININLCTGFVCLLIPNYQCFAEWNCFTESLCLKDILDHVQENLCQIWPSHIELTIWNERYEACGLH